MSIREKLFRYFKGNSAPIFAVRWIGGTRKYIPCRCANTKGFYWLGFLVEWRIPYFEAWAWNPIAQRWEIPATHRQEGESLQ